MTFAKSCRSHLRFAQGHELKLTAVWRKLMVSAETGSHRDSTQFACLRKVGGRLPSEKLRCCNQQAYFLHIKDIYIYIYTSQNDTHLS